ncbi:hypothetical protein J7L01_03230, partial [bacterium]|nr:hypothetical protein [bacterium]
MESRRVQVDVFSEIHDGWNRIIEIDGDETPFDVASNGAGGFVAVGSRETVGGLDLFLVNIGISGDTIWTRVFGGDGDDCGYSIERTADGGYIVAGETESFGAGGSDVWLLKLDSDGDTSWTATYGGPDDEGAHDVILTSGGGYLITGYT